MDSANTWEQINCRLPSDEGTCLPKELPSFGDYENLAERSIGHAMGPLAELLTIGHGIDSAESQAVRVLFRHYLIARQLHDDAHDWADDLLNGRINSVGAMVIERFQKEYKDQRCALITDTLPAMREIFWKEIITTITTMICRNIEAARRARKSSFLIGKTDFMEEALAALESSARKTLAERDEMLLFLKHYHHQPVPPASP